MAEDKNIKDKKPKAEGAAAPAKDAKQEGGIKKKIKVKKNGLKNITVEVKGPGSGRETALRALQARGFKITSIKDMSPMPHNGCRPPKKRRV